MFTEAQLVYFDQAIRNTEGRLFLLRTVIVQMQRGDVLGNPLPEASKSLLETQAMAIFVSVAQGFSAMSAALAAFQAGDPTLLDQIISQA